MARNHEPGSNRVLRTFRREHRLLVRALREWDRKLSAVSVAEVGEEAVVGILEGLEQLIEMSLRPHCARERKALVPVLRHHGLEGMARELAREDRALARECRQLRRALARIRRWSPQAACAVGIRVGERVIARLIEHIHREEADIFPRLEGR